MSEFNLGFLTEDGQHKVEFIGGGAIARNYVYVTAKEHPPHTHILVPHHIMGPLLCWWGIQRKKNLENYSAILDPLILNTT